MSSSPLPLIISSPSGAGKSTLTQRLRAAIPGLHFSVSHTTRSPRANEADGREYHFVDRATFQAMVNEGRFLEWAEVHGNFYGTSRNELDAAAASSARGIIFDIDQQGARQILQQIPDAVTVFVLPPNMETLLTRLRGRASEPEAIVQRRYDNALGEIAHYRMFEYLLVNDDLEDATQHLLGIFYAGECARHRQAGQAEALLRKPSLEV